MSYNQGEGGGGVPIVLPSERADVLDKIQPSKAVDEIQMRCLGMKKVRGAWVKQPFMNKRALSEVGAWELSTLMFSASSQNTAMTKLNPNQIKARLCNLSKKGLLMCLRNWKEYNIDGVDKFHFVNEIIFTNTLASLNQPEGEGMRKFVGNISSGDVGYAEPEQGGINAFRER